MHVHDLFNLNGKVAVVTGGGTGLGQQMATALAEAGADVVLASRNQSRLDGVADELRGLGRRALAVGLDLNDPPAAGRLVEQTLGEFGRLDILVNNAAAQDVNRPFEPFDVARWNAVLAVNLTGALLCCLAAAEPMKAQGRGKIINVASVYGMVGVDGRLYGSAPERPMRNFPYTASKGGLINLTRELAVAWAAEGIQVNALSPGMFPVESNAKKYPDGTFDRIRERIPAGRMGNSTDLKGAVVFLASASSDYVTGHNLVVDGGWTAW
ncbi:MAG: SDR family oxidoreductase [Anaerolineae bacterium]|nr:SDR family oxidoreductase [Anaerolineae bacterium]